MSVGTIKWPCSVRNKFLKFIKIYVLKRGIIQINQGACDGTTFIRLSKIIKSISHTNKLFNPRNVFSTSSYNSLYTYITLAIWVILRRGLYSTPNEVAKQIPYTCSSALWKIERFTHPALVIRYIPVSSSIKGIKFA